MNNDHLYIDPIEATPEQDARARYIRYAADVLRPSSAVGQYSATDPISEVSDVIYLADYIERGPESHWLKSEDDK